MKTSGIPFNVHSAAATVPTHALCVLKKSVTEFMWNGADSNRRRPMVDGTTLERPCVNDGVNCPLVKHITNSRKVALWTRALCKTED